jgi:uncharacterized membrane protein
MNPDIISFDKTLNINAPVNEVFLFWSDFQNFPKFIWPVESVEILDRERSRWIVKAPLDKKVKFDAFITEYIQNRSLSWESYHYAADSSGILRFSELHNSTRVDLNFSYAIKLVWVRKFAKLMNRLGFPSLAFDEGLKKIKHEIEGRCRSVHVVVGEQRWHRQGPSW